MRIWSLFNKRFPAILLMAFFLTAFFLPAEAQSSLDSIPLKTLRGGTVSFGTLSGKSPLVLVCFWSVNSESCISELNAINGQYQAWKKQAAFSLVAVCVDEGNQVNRMRPTNNMNGWTFDVVADLSGDLQKALHFSNVPQSMILRNGEVIYQQAGFETGSELHLFSRLRELSPVKK